MIYLVSKIRILLKLIIICVFVFVSKCFQMCLCQRLYMMSILVIDCFIVHILHGMRHINLNMYIQNERDTLEKKLQLQLV